MKTLRLYGTAINERFIDEAVRSLRDGNAIIYPTDSLYAIGCDAMDNRAVERICRLKGIDPKRQHLAITCADISQAARYAKISDAAFDILRRNLPGAFTFILPTAPTLPKVFKNRRQVGIRIPGDPVACRLAQSLGNPLLTSSIHLPDTDEDTAEIATMEIARHYEHEIDLMLDAGSRGTIPSTVVDLTDPSDPQIIRQGKAVFQQ